MSYVLHSHNKPPMPLLKAFLILAGVGLSQAHMRLMCPQPRDWNDPTTGAHISFDNTGNKFGPCGPFSDQQYWGAGGVTELKPNSWVTITTQESISHTGAPMRLAILDETLTERVVLLDHIPHNDASTSSVFESSYTKYHINVYIPDIQCPKCTLQSISFMTDKTVRCGIQTCNYYPDNSGCSGYTAPGSTCLGAPNSVPCVNENTCFSNYHSCADIVINGNTPPNTGNFAQPATWPNANLTMSQYTQEAATWTSATDGWLVGYPPEFSQPLVGAQDVCTPTFPPSPVPSAAAAASSSNN